MGLGQKIKRGLDDLNKKQNHSEMSSGQLERIDISKISHHENL